MLGIIPENCAELLVAPLATCRFSEKRGKLEESDKVGLDLVASSFYLHRLEKGSAGLGKSVASFLMIRAVYPNFHRARTSVPKCKP